jgi:thioredoxin 1
MATVKVTDDSFEADVLHADKPVLVDFWAEWCGPCKQIAPALEQLSEELSGQLIVAKVDTQDNLDIPTRYGVRNIPTLMLFKDGKLASTQVGAVPKSKLLEWLNSAGVQAA